MKQFVLLLLCGCGSMPPPEQPDPFDVYVSCMNQEGRINNCVDSTIHRMCKKTEIEQVKAIYQNMRVRCSESDEECAAWSVTVATGWCDERS